MRITNVRREGSATPATGLMAGLAVEFDGQLVVHEIKVIRQRGSDRSRLVMPTTLLRDNCPACERRNVLRARFCNWCGARLADNRHEFDRQGRPKLEVGAVHPSTAAFRQYLEEELLTQVNTTENPSSPTP